MHAVDDTPIKNAATRDTHCNFMCQGGGTSQCSSSVEEERDETSRKKQCRPNETKPNSTRYTLAKDTIVLHIATPQAASISS